jgi:hypothetical protein
MHVYTCVIWGLGGEGRVLTFVGRPSCEAICVEGSLKKKVKLGMMVRNELVLKRAGVAGALYIHVLFALLVLMAAAVLFNYTFLDHALAQRVSLVPPHHTPNLVPAGPLRTVCFDRPLIILSRNRL